MLAYLLQVLDVKAPSSKTLAAYETNIKAKMIETGAVRRKLEKWLQKCCNLDGLFTIVVFF